MVHLLTGVGFLGIRRADPHRGSRADVGIWVAVAGFGVLMIVVVIPALIAGGLVLSMSALMLWSLTFIPLGLAVAATPQGNHALR